jgi:hypothetical protein
MEFPDCHFRQPSTRQNMIANTSQAVVAFDFRRRAGGAAVEPLPSWLSIEPVAGLLYPGQKLALSVTVEVGPDSAASLLLGKSKLQIQLADGLTIRGSYAPSPFGLPLTLLCHLPRPLGKHFTHARTHEHTHKHTHTHTHTYTQTQKHTCIHTLLYSQAAMHAIRATVSPL